MTISQILLALSIFAVAATLFVFWIYNLTLNDVKAWFLKLYDTVSLSATEIWGISAGIVLAGILLFRVALWALQIPFGILNWELFLCLYAIHL